METLQRTANRGSISTGFDIDNSIVFETANSERVYRANGNTGQRRTFTISAWVKRTALGYHRTFGVGVSGNNQMIIIFNSSDQIHWYDYHGGSYSFNYITNRLFRDLSAWYHLVFAVDTEQGTEANRVRLYVNGVEETSFATQTEPALNRETNWNYADGSKDVGNILNEAPFASCYMSEVYHINDQQLAPTDFGEFDDDTGIWKPKAFTGTFGSEDSYLNFDSSGSMGADSSGNSNDFTLQNITSADQATDTPTNNFATLNPLMISNRVTITNGATSIISAGVDGNSTTTTMGVSNGKWYWEFYMTSNGGTAYWPAVGYTTDPSQTPNESTGNAGTPSKVALLPNGSTYINGSIIGSQFSALSANDIAGFALDMDNGNMYIYKNGTIQNSGNAIFTSIGDFAMPVIDTSADAPAGGYFNFGGYTVNTISSAASDANGYGTFEYAPPSGYYALCTKNLAEFG